MTGRQRSSTSVVADQFSQWSNTFRHRLQTVQHCSTAALQHCSLHTAQKLDRHISVHWSSVWSRGGLLMLLL